MIISLRRYIYICFKYYGYLEFFVQCLITFSIYFKDEELIIQAWIYLGKIVHLIILFTLYFAIRSYLIKYNRRIKIKSWSIYTLKLFYEFNPLTIAETHALLFRTCYDNVVEFILTWNWFRLFIRDLVTTGKNFVHPRLGLFWQ